MAISAGPKPRRSFNGCFLTPTKLDPKLGTCSPLWKRLLRAISMQYGAHRKLKALEDVQEK